jgi:hypothetical protein
VYVPVAVPLSTGADIVGEVKDLLVKVCVESVSAIICVAIIDLYNLRVNTTKASEVVALVGPVVQAMVKASRSNPPR